MVRNTKAGRMTKQKAIATMRIVADELRLVGDEGIHPSTKQRILLIRETLTGWAVDERCSGRDATPAGVVLKKAMRLMFQAYGHSLQGRRQLEREASAKVATELPAVCDRLAEMIGKPKASSRQRKQIDWTRVRGQVMEELRNGAAGWSDSRWARTLGVNRTTLFDSDSEQPQEIVSLIRTSEAIAATHRMQAD